MKKQSIQSCEDPELKGNEAPATAVTQKDTLMDEIHQLHERILARRGGKPIEIDALELVRSERDDELTAGIISSQP